MPNVQSPPQSSPSSQGPHVLVLGGTGFLGSSLCRQLAELAAFHGTVTVATRQAAAGAHLAHLPHLEVAQLDIFDAAQLARLVDRHDILVNLVAILHGDAAKFRRVHVELVETIASVCKAAGKTRIVHVSALGAGDDAPSMYLRSKTEGEYRLRVPSIDAAILRPSVIFGANDRFLNMFARLLRFAPVLPLASAHARFQPVWVEDVAAAIVRCIEAPSTAGLYECAGPRVYELRELVALAGRLSGHPRPVLPLPDFLGRAQATMLEALPGEPMMSRDNLDSMKRPNVSTGLPGLKELGILAATLEEIAAKYLARAA